MTTGTDKARAQRLARLETSLEQKLEQPAAALETLLAELNADELRPDLWERLHAAAARDGKEQELAAAYGKATAARRLASLREEERIALRIHAADFYQGLLGDGELAAKHLRAALAESPGHVEAYTRLERRLEAIGDRHQLAELYASVAAHPPIAAADLATKAVNTVGRLPASAPLSDETCLALLALLPASHAILGVLDSHCRKTGRFGLACRIIEQALGQGVLPRNAVLERRRYLIDLYLGEAHTPELAIWHIEDLLQNDPADAQARAAAQRLLKTRAVASRAAAALTQARHRVRGEE